MAKIEKEKALDVVRQMVADGQVSQDVAEKYFPELKESKDSEDEKIRKWCISHFKECIRVTKDNAEYQEYLNNKVITWLEKQGQQKPAIIIPKFRVGDTIRIKNSDAEYTITEISDGYYRGKGWCLDIAAGDECGDYEIVEQTADEVKPKFKVGDVMRTLQEASDGIKDGLPVVVSIDDECYRCNNEIIPIADQENYEYPPKNRKQSIAWSEEDKKMSRFIGNAITADDASMYLKSKGIQVIDAHVWLENLKDKVQPKQEWGEEDEKVINLACSILYSNFNENENFDKNQMCIGEIINKLKSLKDRYTWKPSDEQMNALRYVTNFDYGGHKATLVSLYEQLKKLKDEK